MHHRNRDARAIFTKSFISCIAAIGLSLAAAGAARAATNIVYILDASNSMWGQIDGVAKIETARGAMSDLLANVEEGTTIALMVYGHRSEGACDDIELVSPLGADTPKQIKAVLDGIKPKGKTPIAGALKAAADVFPTNDANNNIILISDGIETCNGDPCAVAGDLAKAGVGVKVHAVGFDVDDAARKQLECIANAGGGSYYNASNAEEFKVAVAEVQEAAQTDLVAKPEPEPAPTANIVFEDEFDTAELAPHWEVRNPNPDAFIVEDGKLLLVSSKQSGFSTATTPNLMILSQEMPKGDWELSATVSAEYATAQEGFWIGMYKDEKNYVAARIFSGGNQYYGWSLKLSVEKASGGEVSTFETTLRSLGCNVCGEGRMFPDFAKTIADPMRVTLVREGRKMYARAEIAGEVDENGKQVVHQTEPISALRVPGGPVLTVGQAKDVSGETLFFVDRAEIKSLQ